MPEDVRQRTKHVACNVGFNKSVVFHGNIEIITNMGESFHLVIRKESLYE